MEKREFIEEMSIFLAGTAIVSYTFLPQKIKRDRATSPGFLNAKEQASKTILRWMTAGSDG